MNRTVRIRGAALMHQQCWCWGADVRSAEGNLLTGYGFRRVCAPEGIRGSTKYQCRLTRANVTLWGFGMFFSHEGADGIFLSRYGFEPKFTGEPKMLHHLFQPDYTIAMQPVNGNWNNQRNLFADAVDWIARYEGWVLREYGIRYRKQSMEQWPLIAVPAGEIAEAWSDLAAEVRALSVWEQDEPPPPPAAFATQRT